MYLACELSIPEYSTSGFISVADAIEFMQMSTFDQPEVALSCVTPMDNESATRPVGLVAVQGHVGEMETERFLLVSHCVISQSDSQPASQPASLPASELARAAVYS